MKKINNSITEIKVSYNPNINNEAKLIQSSMDAFHIFSSIWNPNTINMFEEFKVLYLNRGNTVIGYRDIARGGTSSCVVDVKIILAIGIKSNCSSIILAHNHPSRNLKPSQADISLTKKISQAAKLFDIQLLDQLIMTSLGYYSFADEGLL